MKIIGNVDTSTCEEIGIPSVSIFHDIQFPNTKTQVLGGSYGKAYQGILHPWQLNLLSIFEVLWSSDRAPASAR